MSNSRITIAITCVLIVLALVVTTGCGDGDKKNKDSSSKDHLDIENIVTEEYAGTISEIYPDEFFVDSDSGVERFIIADDMVRNFGNSSHMFIGDIVSVTYEAKEEGNIALEVTIIEDESDPEDGVSIRGVNLGDFAATLCWPYGEMSKGRYGKGSMNDEYRALYDKLRPQDDSGIGAEQWNAGASCDLFVATALRGFGLDDFPVTLSGQCKYFFLTDDYKADFEKVETNGLAENMQHGDIGIYIRKGSENNGQGHIFIVNKSEGQNWRSNAHYKLGPGYYGVTDDLRNYDPGDYKYFGVFRLK